MNHFNQLRNLLENDKGLSDTERNIRIAAAGRGEAITPIARRATAWFLKKGYTKVGRKWIKPGKSGTTEKK